MPILLYGVGAIAFAMGAAAIGYGIPINEFSFGNTLIISGAVFAAGGLVVLALGVVVSRLQQLSDALARPAALRSGRVEAEMPVPIRAGVQPAPARMPFPPKPKPPRRPDLAPEPTLPPEPMPAESKAELPPPPRPFAMPPLPKRPLREQEDVAALSPVLPNPEEGADAEHDEEPMPTVRAEVTPPAQEPEPFVSLAASLSSRQAAEEAEAEHAEPEEPEEHAAEPAEREPRRFEPFEPEPFRVPPISRAAQPFRPAEPVNAEPGSFDAMWPASAKPAEANPVKPREPVAADLAPGKSGTFDEASPGEPPHEELRAVAILKSGVVDGMSYTLYVDGSIEAELPQGTLRFASINELRAHLEKGS